MLGLVANLPQAEMERSPLSVSGVRDPELLKVSEPREAAAVS